MNGTRSIISISYGTERKVIFINFVLNVGTVGPLWVFYLTRTEVYKILWTKCIVRGTVYVRVYICLHPVHVLVRITSHILWISPSPIHSHTHPHPRPQRQHSIKLYLNRSQLVAVWCPPFLSHQNHLLHRSATLPCFFISTISFVSIWS